MKKIIFALFVLFLGFDNSTFLRILPISIFVLVIVDYLVLNNFRFSFPKKPFHLLLMLALMILIGVFASGREDVTFRYNLFKSITFGLFLITFYTILFDNIGKKDLYTLFLYLVYLPLTLYVVLNLFVFSLGISNGIGGEALILSNFDVNIGRVSFLFSNGVNSYGSFLGILLSLSLIGCFVIKRNKKIFLIGLVSSMVSLLLTDSRGAIAYSFLILGAIKFYYFKVDKPKFLYFVPILTIVGPLLLLLFLSFLSTTEYGSIISRKDGDLATGNSRAIIWGIAVSDFLNFELNHHVFGYGEWGHYTSGASPKYALVFGDSYEANFMHPHNTSISILLDYGYFGLIIYTMIQYKIINIIKKYWSTNKVISCLLLTNILYFNLVGIGETMFGFYYQNVTYVFFMINIFAFLLDYQRKKELQRKKYV